MKENEIKFMEYMTSTVLPNRRNVSYDVLITAGNFVGIGINTSCRSCAAKSGTDLLNRYGQLKQTWEQYKKDLELKKEAEKIEVFIYEQSLKDIAEAEELPLLVDFVEAGKTEEFHTLDNERSSEMKKDIIEKMRTPKNFSSAVDKIKQKNGTRGH